MLDALNQDTVKSFLIICKKEIKKGNRQLIPRTIEKDGKVISFKQLLLDLNIMKIEQIWDYILQLECFECQKIDFDYDKKRDFNSEIFVFKKLINNKNIYIKLTIREPRGVICISFHESY